MNGPLLRIWAWLDDLIKPLQFVVAQLAPLRCDPERVAIAAPQQEHPGGHAAWRLFGMLKGDPAIAVLHAQRIAIHAQATPDHLAHRPGRIFPKNLLRIFKRRDHLISRKRGDAEALRGKEDISDNLVIRFGALDEQLRLPLCRELLAAI